MDDLLDVEVLFRQPAGGTQKGTFEYNLVNNDYTVNTQIENWKLAPFKPYVTSGIQLSEFNGSVFADLNITGNATTDFIKSQGQVTVDDFKIIDPENKPLVSVGKFFMDIKQINSQENIYDFNDILVDNSYVSFEYLPNGDNFSKWLVTSNSSANNASAEKKAQTDYYVSPLTSRHNNKYRGCSASCGRR